MPKPWGIDGPLLFRLIAAEAINEADGEASVIEGVIHIQVLPLEADTCHRIAGLEQVVAKDREGGTAGGETPLGRQRQVEDAVDIEGALDRAGLIAAVHLEREVFADLEGVVPTGYANPFAAIERDVEIVVATLAQTETGQVEPGVVPLAHRQGQGER